MPLWFTDRDLSARRLYWKERAYGLDDRRVILALAAETGPDGLPGRRAGAARAGVMTAWLVKLQRDLLRDRLKERTASPCPRPSPPS